MASKKPRYSTSKSRRVRAGVDWALLAQKIAARADLSIAEWCARRDVCRASFTNYVKSGIGPRLTKAAGRVTISAAADDEWEQRFSQPTRGRPRKDTGSADEQPPT